MGVLSRIRKKVQGTGRLIKDVVEVIRDEARHPGRPPSRHAAESPLWKEDPNDSAHQKARAGVAEARAQPAAPVPVDSRGRDGERLWFLDGNQVDEGWEKTNAKEPAAEATPKSGT